ncbi:dipeptide epimerase [Crateriforma conspicua]|uniref:dipeptide epimerase n=1 Tax=Crateriforma conspicua TaxID=2527996 RepID=UPI00118B6961|nr:dipeptide epimerase [Crateriforma conspicua]QDV64861.1 L-Ala-D/L-Glu epimerase [Crateriforma conspicua]
MQIFSETVTLHPEHPFGISRETIPTQRSVIVQLQHLDHVGWGEVTENRFYGRTAESIQENIRIAADMLSGMTELLTCNDGVKQIWDQIAQRVWPDTFALSAIDSAVCDWTAKHQNVPTHQIWGLDWTSTVPSSFTIGLDTVDRMVTKLRQRPGWPVYKIKLGSDDDLDIVQRLRGETDAVFRVDANGGWDVDKTIAMSQAMETLNVQFIEQPLPIDAPESAKRDVFTHSRLPLIADEDCQVAADVAKCSGMYHGISVKLCKCGGLTPAIEMLRHARRLGLSTMVGCMVESSIGISAAAQLLPLLDFADLDGAELLDSDPAMGASVNRGIVTLAVGNGHAASMRQHSE